MFKCAEVPSETFGNEVRQERNTFLVDLKKKEKLASVCSTVAHDVRKDMRIAQITCQLFLCNLSRKK